MGLAQGIVIVNEYTINKGGKGSRGSTPGDYVTNYMSRGTATETLTPVKLTEQADRSWSQTVVHFSFQLAK